jgi:hypothetical protein
MERSGNNPAAQVVLEGFPVPIDRAEVVRMLGRKRGAPQKQDAAERAARFDADVDAAIERAADLIAPKGIYTVTAGDELPGSTMFDDLEIVAFCICTIGPALEERVTALTSSDRLLEAVVLDAAGSVAAEAVADHMDREIQKRAAERGLKTSCRASPGYGDWDVREQESIFRLLDGGRIGVTLSPGCMMTPRKSVSFAIHVAERPARMRSENSCRNCTMKDCPYRLLS